MPRPPPHRPKNASVRRPLSAFLGLCQLSSSGGSREWRSQRLPDGSRTCALWSTLVGHTTLQYMRRCMARTSLPLRSVHSRSSSKRPRSSLLTMSFSSRLRGPAASREVRSLRECVGRRSHAEKAARGGGLRVGGGGPLRDECRRAARRRYDDDHYPTHKRVNSSQYFLPCVVKTFPYFPVFAECSAKKLAVI